MKRSVVHQSSQPPTNLLTEFLNTRFARASRSCNLFPCFYRLTLDIASRDITPTTVDNLLYIPRTGMLFKQYLETILSINQHRYDKSFEVLLWRNNSRSPIKAESLLISSIAGHKLLSCQHTPNKMPPRPMPGFIQPALKIISFFPEISQSREFLWVSFHIACSTELSQPPISPI